MKNVFEHSWMTLSFDADSETLELTWHAATADMSVGDFQIALAMYAVEAASQGATRLLVDTRAFRFGGFADAVGSRGYVAAGNS